MLNFRYWLAHHLYGLANAIGRVAMRIDPPYKEYPFWQSPDAPR